MIQKGKIITHDAEWNKDKNRKRIYHKKSNILSSISLEHFSEDRNWVVTAHEVTEKETKKRVQKVGSNPDVDAPTGFLLSSGQRTLSQRNWGHEDNSTKKNVTKQKKSQIKKAVKKANLYQIFKGKVTSGFYVKHLGKSFSFFQVQSLRIWN